MELFWPVANGGNCGKLRYAVGIKSAYGYPNL